MCSVGQWLPVTAVMAETARLFRGWATKESFLSE
jgi:hypothetical protein